MKLGREIAGLVRSVNYDLRRSRRARMYLIVAVFSLAAVTAAVIAASQLPGLAETTGEETSQDPDQIGPAGLTEQHGSTADGRGGAVTGGAAVSPPVESPSPAEPTTESSEWTQPSPSATSEPQPEPSVTTSSPDPSDSGSPSVDPSPTESSPTPSQEPGGKDQG